jgi:hypothetical protein
MLIEGFCRDLPGRVEVSRGRTFVSSGVIGGWSYVFSLVHPWHVMSQDRVEAGFVTVRRAELCASQYFLR